MSNQKSLGSESNQKSLGSESNQKSLGSESNQKSLGSESKESLGSESNQRSLGIKLLLSVSQERAIKDPSASRFDRVIKRVSAASNWHGAQDVSPYKSVSGMAAIRSLSVVRAIMKSWLEASAKQARKPSKRTLAIVLPRTSNERCVPYHLRVYNYVRRIGDQGGGCTWCNRCSSAGKKGC